MACRHFLLVLAALLVHARESLARGDGTFAEPLTFRNVLSPVSLAAGDFNGDGKLDLALVSGDWQVRFFFQNSNDRLMWRVGLPLTVGSRNTWILAEDVDGDGDHDLLVADEGYHPFFIRCRGGGLFDQPVALKQSWYPRAMAAGDLDGDGLVDLAITSSLGTDGWIFRGQPGGEFVFSDILKITNSSLFPAMGIALFDLNGDGFLDIAYGAGSWVIGQGLQVILGTGGGAIQPLSFLWTFGCVQGIAAGDFNGDGKDDLAATCLEARSGTVGISQGDGTFVTTLDGSRNFFGYGPVVSDMNGDGFPDIAVTQPGLIRAFIGKGDGMFTSPFSFGPRQRSSWGPLIAADLDRDGMNEIVVGESGGVLSIHWGRKGDRVLEDGFLLSLPHPAGPSRPIVDIDRNGAPDILAPSLLSPEVYVFLNPGVTASPEPSLAISVGAVLRSIEAIDLDGDGSVDIAGVDHERGELLAILLDPRAQVKERRLVAVFSEPGGPPFIAAGLIDDGRSVDLLVWRRESSDVQLFLGIGNGDFLAPRRVPAVIGIKTIGLKDLDANGRLDLLLDDGETLRALYDTGGGNFTAPVDLTGPIATGKSLLVAAGDVDGDSVLDLVAVERGSSSATVYWGSAGRIPRGKAPLKLDTKPWNLELADLDGNGLADILSNDVESRMVTVQLNRGGLDLDPPSFNDAPLVGSDSMGTADLDLDGSLDLIVHSAFSIAVLFGRLGPAGGPRFRRGDADGDGRMELNDPIATLSALFLGQGFRSCDDARDSNDDGVLDVADPIFSLSHLFLGGETPPPPGPALCGEDPTEDRLGLCRDACR